MSEEKRATEVSVPNMCQTHQGLLVGQCGYSESETWRSLIIASQIALFQAVTVNEKICERLGGEITRVRDLGCLACLQPDRFGEIVETAITAGKARDVGEIKSLGERWIKAFKPVSPLPALGRSLRDEELAMLIDAGARMAALVRRAYPSAVFLLHPETLHELFAFGRRLEIGESLKEEPARTLHGVPIYACPSLRPGLLTMPVGPCPTCSCDLGRVDADKAP